MVAMSPVGTLEKPQNASAFADLMPLAMQRFAEIGAAGLLVVQAVGFDRVERSHGLKGYQKVRAGLHNVVDRYVTDHLGPDGLVISGEMGADELLILIFRPRTDWSFYTDRLHRIPGHLRDYVEQHLSRIIFPFYGEAPDICVGSAMSIRNPALLDERQLRAAVDRARRDSELAARLSLREHRRAFERYVLTDQIECAYQPIVDLATGQLHGYESLARGPADSGWERPDVLFDMAEKTGLLFEVDSLCRKVALRDAAGKIPTGVKLFLNCLPSAIHDSSFQADRLRRTLDICNLTPSDLVFEISEKESIKNFPIFRETRDYYRGLGIKFALDDTGAGYASLEAMMQVAPDYVKVTASLVKTINADPARHALMDALQNMARAIGAAIVAEGIETPEELAALQELGVDYGQGFILGRPGPLA
jgi:EAL domain-containing protein (putative c-di-GMP-specific phosphodiesterase class I)